MFLHTFLVNMILKFSQFLLYLFIFFPLSYGADTLASNQSLSGNQTLISFDQNFEMGFFKPGKSSNYYIGIWYKTISPRTVVWVANRDTPISNSSSSKLKIVSGNLVLLNESNTQIWSTNMSTSATSGTIVLLDNGNLVLRQGLNSSPPIWQSFDHPTDTFLPGNKIGYNKRTKTKQVLTAWKSSEDPGMGLFSFEFDHNIKQYVIKWNRSVEYWASGSWVDRNQSFSLVPEMGLNYLLNFSYVDNENESYMTYFSYNPSIISRYHIDVLGQIKQLSWLPATLFWNAFWTQPRDLCDVYGRCGPFGVCNPEKLALCNCLNDFEPRSQSEWDLGIYTGGCVRKIALDCSNTTRKSKFIVSYVKRRSLSIIPEKEAPSILSLGESACRRSCFNYCSCNAFSYISNNCHQWNLENLTNMSPMLLTSGQNLDPIYIKVPSFDHSKLNTKVLTAGIVSGCLSLLFLCCIAFIFYKRMKSRDTWVLSEEDRKGLDVPFFEFKSILSATDNFSLANKLGEGGFGPVYKATYPEGTEMAVKRLSSQSRQGLKEFLNEVLLIAKLQHRNLIRLLGYGMKTHEMILLYEYMPNKSLDHFIFDKKLSTRLDWALRFDIIMGIARGLLYLHQDSRLKIIHRDLKASNVLLDADMNPKISDFGLAKIVKGRDTDCSLTRVVGTYGYMAPEYALNGLFSVKSDVFSFGVVILEIISGKRNTGYYQNNEAFILMSYVWDLWKERKPLDLLDPVLDKSCNSNEVLRCITIGLLCVQEDPQERPTMTGVVDMLAMDIDVLQDPKQPAFVSKKGVRSLQSYVNESGSNLMTITEEEGR